VAGLWAHALPAYMDRWSVAYILCQNWDKIGRSGDSGFDSVKGVICHHDAIGPGAGEDTWRSSIPPRWGGNRTDGPVGNGSLDHNGVFRFWAAGAANTAGQGGPMLSSRGVIALDSANRCTFNIEARNNGVGEPWTPAQVEAYPRLVAAVLDWANHETPGAPLGVGDVWSHALGGPGWTNRKIDPSTTAGTSWGPAQNSSGTWNMHAFRASVFAVLMAGTGTIPPLPIDPQEDDDVDKFLVRHPNNQMYITDLMTYAIACTEDEGVNLRDGRGAQVDPDTGGPWLLSNPVEAEYVRRIADR
jgi:N-acetylmuramoyl-L-alanine amidase